MEEGKRRWCMNDSGYFRKNKEDCCKDTNVRNARPSDCRPSSPASIIPESTP